MSNTKSSPKNLNGLLVAACVSLFGLMGTAQSSAAPITASDTAFDDPNAFELWDGGFAATQKKFAADAITDNARVTPAAALAAASNAPASKSPPTAAAATVATLADIAGSQIINWTFNLDNLLQRVGEVRLENLASNNGGDLHYNGNLWARAYGNRVNAAGTLAGSAFHEYTYGASIGADKTLVQGPDGTALIGLIGDFSKTNRAFNNGGDGSTRNAGIGLYATLLCREGWFADIAGRIDTLDTKFTTAASNGSPAISGDYTTNMETISLEAGRVFMRDDGWWLETSLQAALAWAGAGSCHTTPDTQQLRVKLDGGRDLQYRAMIRFGRRIGGSCWYPYAKIAVAKVDTEGGAVHVGDTFAITPDYSGPRAEFGLGAACCIAEFNQIYFDYTYSTALNYNSPWSANLGYRLLW